MSKKTSIRIAVVAALLVVVAVPSVMAKGPRDRAHLYRECASHQKLSAGYKLRTLRVGLSELPDALGAYTGCPAAIRGRIATLTGRSPAAVDVEQIYRECGDEGILHPGHHVRALRRALREIPTDLAEYTPCQGLLLDAISAGSSRYAPSGAKRIFRDCGHHGRLLGSYKLRILRRAQSRLPGELARYSACSSAIRRAISARTSTQHAR